MSVYLGLFVHPAEGYSVVFGMTYCLGHYTAKNYL